MEYRIAGIEPNDVVNGEGICVSIFTQGCPHHCPGCFNPETWSPRGGQSVNINKFLTELNNLLNQNGISRNLSILGGEPLWDNNLIFTYLLCYWFRKQYPKRLIFIWTGYTLDELRERHDKHIDYILDNINFLIDGRFEQDKKDIGLLWRGSANQTIWQIEDKNIKKYKERG